MSARRELHYAATVHRIIWNKRPEYLFEKLVWIKDITLRSLRSFAQTHLQIPKHRTPRYRRGFRFTAASIWNDLPPPLRNKMTTELFKSKYKSALLKKQLAAENMKPAYHKCLKLKKFFNTNEPLDKCN